MIRLRHAALATLMMTMLGACATGPTFQGAPAIQMTPQTVMSGRPCSGLPPDKFSQWNPGPMGSGWSKTPWPGGELSCGTKYLPSLYCADKSRCVGATWGTNTPPSMNSANVHWIVDVLQGSISVCAQQSGRWGTGSLACTRTVCAATGSTPTRCVLPVQVLGQAQPQGSTEIVFDALRDQTVVGAIGTAEVMN